MALDLTDAQTFLTASITFITDFGLMPVILASAVAGLGAFAFRRAKSAAR